MILAMHAPAFAAQEISFSGEQDGYFESGQYVATGTIKVKRGKTLTFAPGCVIRFKQFAGIVVEGTLKCVGWPSQPVVFTSDNNRPKSDDTQYKIPAPFDWNGITVTDSAASVYFEYVRIAYSTYGLDVKSTASRITLKGVVFSENGRGGITIEEKQLGVIDNEQFSFVQPEQANEVPFEKKQPGPKPKEKNPPQNKMTWRTPVRLTLGVVTVTGLVAGIYENMQGVKYYGPSQDPKNKNAENDLSKTQTAENLRNICYGIAIAAVCGFTLTFFF
jgi:hypothetical protein